MRSARLVLATALLLTGAAGAGIASAVVSPPPICVPERAAYRAAGATVNVAVATYISSKSAAAQARAAYLAGSGTLSDWQTAKAAVKLAKQDLDAKRGIRTTQHTALKDCVARGGVALPTFTASADVVDGYLTVSVTGTGLTPGAELAPLFNSVFGGLFGYSESTVEADGTWSGTAGGACQIFGTVTRVNIFESGMPTSGFADFLNPCVDSGTNGGTGRLGDGTQGRDDHAGDDSDA